MIRHPFAWLGFSVALLSACANSGSGPVSQRVSAQLPDSDSYSYDPATDKVTLTDSGAVLDTLLPSGTAGLNGTFNTYTQGQTTVIRGTTGSGKGRAAVIFSPASGHGLLGAIVEVDAPVTLPASGSADFKGDYAGFVVRDDLAVGGPINGETCLNANFASQSISGSIRNRNSYSYSNVTIPALPINPDGSFSGAVSGGASTSGFSLSLGGSSPACLPIRQAESWWARSGSITRSAASATRRLAPSQQAAAPACERAGSDGSGQSGWHVDACRHALAGALCNHSIHERMT